MGKHRLLNGAVVVMGLAALITTSLAVRKALAPPSPEPQYDIPERVDEWKRFQRGGSRIGPADAAVTIVEFSDFQCSYCRVYAERVDRLRRAYPEQITLVFRHYPITDRHPHAYNAALASECAREQGRFEEYRSVLFRSQAHIGAVSWSEFAQRAGVPQMEHFARCMSDRRHARRIAADMKMGERLGIPATPTILVNEWRLVGVPEEQTLAGLVRDALDGAAATRKRGTADR